MIAPRTSATVCSNCETLFDYSGKKAVEAEIEREMSQSDFWNSQQRAQETVNRLKALRQILKPLEDAIK
ncbi:MAG: hypothetical protein ACOY3P_23690, partial [Planctomycetota bacterium]